MLNHIIIMGRLTKNPELRYTQGGVPVCTFSLAVDRDVKDSTTGKKTADFIDVVVWRGTAEMVANYFTKGSMMAVSGRLQMRSWVDNDGNNRKSAEIISDRVYFAGSNKSNKNGKNPAPVTEVPQMEEIDEDDGNLPF